MNSDPKLSVVGSRSSVIHKSVLLKESVDLLDLQDGDIFLDGTFGAGGHSREVLSRFGSRVRVIALDQDPTVLEGVSEETENLEIAVTNFRHLDKVLREIGVERVNAILLDLGISSDQLESSGKGFSFQKDEPLDMRMGREGFTAQDVLNVWDEDALETIIRGFGEERFSKRIAAAIVEARKIRPFVRTTDLVRVVESVRPRRFDDKIHPATKTFQALRIAVNEELTSLEEGLEKGFKALTPQGRMAVISFHSLEDRIVKNFFRDRAKDGEATIITKKPVTPNRDEALENPRSRSAKLRVVEKNE